MKKVLIFAGTTEGRILSECLSAARVFHEVCVATEYGEQTMQESSYMKLRSGRLDMQGMRDLYAATEYLAVVDCTHPFATVVTQNIRQSLEGMGIPYFRVGRRTNCLTTKKNIVSDGNAAKQQGNSNGTMMDLQMTSYENVTDLAAALQQTEGNILLTTGSKDLPVFCADENLKKRLIVRVLPGRESLELCYENGLEGKQIIAMQGPFSKEMNLATIRQYQITALVTKESGKTGGVDEKIQAAMEAGIACYVLKRPENGMAIRELSMADVLVELEKLTGVSLKKKATLHITVGGLGMGTKAGMTVALKEQLEKADYIFGAKRMVEGWKAKKAVYPYYLAKDILPVLQEAQAEEPGDISAVILYSGDTGFYSGSSKLCKELQKLENCKVNILPGISSLAAFSAALGESWQDAYIVSAHGTTKEKWCAQMLFGVRHGRKTFLLTSGFTDVQEIGHLLLQYELAEKVQIAVGYQLSYPEQKIQILTAQECCEISAAGLYVVMLLPVVTESVAQGSRIVPGWKDEIFLRDKVPMTKEEVRAVSICKLAPTANAVIYDIGSGTGSIAFELAALSPDIKVYALERKAEAVELLHKNKEKFGAFQVEIIEAEAPDGMEELPAPGYAFIGGSGGNLMAILDVLYQKNPQMKVVMNAISLESISEMQQAVKNYPVTEVDITTVSVSKAKEVGAYHLMQANNPVTIFSFQFVKQ